MTRKDFIEFKGWDKQVAETYIGGFWNFENWWKNQDNPISMYELWCDVPFYALNKEYNKVYRETNGEIGSTYDWLEGDATDEQVKKYLHK